MSLPLTDEHPARTYHLRRFTIAAAVAAVIASIGLGGFIYYRNNSPTQLAIKARLAMEQHDPNRAIEFLTRALSKNPSGDALTDDRILLAKALIDAGREVDARTYLQQALTEKPDNAEALDMLAESHVHPAFRKFQDAFKPISAAAAADVLATIHTELNSLSTGTQDARTQIAEAELDHLSYLIVSDQTHQANAALQAAQIAQDGSAITQAQQQLSAIKDPPSLYRDRARDSLLSAMKQDPKNQRAASLLAQYDYEDHTYAEPIALYNQMKTLNAVSQELAITAANTLIVDSDLQPDRLKRFAAAQKVLESFLADHPQDSRILVSVGQVMLEQNLITDAAAMADQASAQSPGDLDAQILRINCRLRESKITEAKALILPLTNSHSNVPQVWYLLGLANSNEGNYSAAEDALRKAMSLNPSFIPARRLLLTDQILSHQTDSSPALATQILHDDPYFMPAWSITVESMRKLGQSDRAKTLLTNLSEDPALPAEDKPDLIRLLVDFDAPAPAQKLLAALPPNDVETIHLRASIADATGDIAVVRTLMAQAVAAAPANVDLRLQYADLLMEAHLPADARSQLDAVAAGAAKTPLASSDSLHVARSYLALRLPDRASAIVKNVLASQPKNEEALALSRQIADTLNGNQGSTPIANSASSTQPGSNAPDSANAADIQTLAQTALANKQYAKALSLVRPALAKDSNNSSLHQIAARAYAALGQYDSAVEEIATAANAQPDSLAPFSMFVELFPDSESASRGLAYGGRLLSINPALGDWAMGRLAEISGQPDLALRYYTDGIQSTNRLTDPDPAKDALYSAVLSLQASKKDGAALIKAADQFAKDPSFAIGIRLTATADLLAIGERSSAVQQLTTLTDALNPATNSPRITLAVAQSWMSLGQPDQARALIEKQIAAGNKDPMLLAADAKLLQQSDPQAALKRVEELAAQDRTNPHYLIVLAETQSAVGDDVSALRTLDNAGTLGETGRDLAAAARVRLLISRGLFQEAADELASRQSLGSDDFASMFSIGQAWTQIHRPDEARKILSAIPPYAAEYVPARITLANLDLDAGKNDAAMEALKNLKPSSPSDANQIASSLFYAYLHAGKAADALALAKDQRSHTLANTDAWRTATLFAAGAAREARRYDDAASLLQSLDPAAQKQSALDLALIQLLQKNDSAADKTADDLSDAAPNYLRTTIQCLASAHDPSVSPLAGETLSAQLSNAGPAAVYAMLSTLSSPQRTASLPALRKNPHIFADDVAVLLRELPAAPDAAQAALKKLALSQRLIESGWTTSALDVLDTLGTPGDSSLTLALIQRHQALTDLKRTEDAGKIHDLLSARLTKDPSAAPGVRILLAAAAANDDHYADALALLQPLESLNRPDILTTLASFHEHLGQLDDAIAIHRRIRQMDPSNILAANNLAYTLAAAHPTDKAALAEALSAIQFAIKSAPQVTAFQDTLGWIEILSGNAAEGTQRIARAIPEMKMDPAVHYHLGIGYARIGQNDLARLHLNDVEILAQNDKQKLIPERALATAALKSLPAAAPN